MVNWMKIYEILQTFFFWRTSWIWKLAINQEEEECKKKLAEKVNKWKENGK